MCLFLVSAVRLFCFGTKNSNNTSKEVSLIIELILSVQFSLYIMNASFDFINQFRPCDFNLRPCTYNNQKCAKTKYCLVYFNVDQNCLKIRKPSDMRSCI